MTVSEQNYKIRLKTTNISKLYLALPVLVIFACCKVTYLKSVKSKRRHWIAVTLSFTPCGDRQTDFYYNEEISLALYTVCLC